MSCKLTIIKDNKPYVIDTKYNTEEEVNNNLSEILLTLSNEDIKALNNINLRPELETDYVYTFDEIKGYFENIKDPNLLNFLNEIEDNIEITFREKDEIKYLDSLENNLTALVNQAWWFSNNDGIELPIDAINDDLLEDKLGKAMKYYNSSKIIKENDTQLKEELEVEYEKTIDENIKNQISKIQQNYITDDVKVNEIFISLAVANNKTLSKLYDLSPVGYSDFNDIDLVEDEEIPFSLHNSLNNKSHDSKESIGYISQRITELYGTNIVMLSDEEVKELSEDTDNNFNRVRAFELDNILYINQDKASIAEPLHELTHIILPGLKNKNINLYNVLIDKITDHPSYDIIKKNYPNLSEDNLNNEVFCSIFAEYYREKMLSTGANNWLSSEFINFVNPTKNVISDILDLQEGEKLNDLALSNLMQMNLEDILLNFGSSIVSGKFKNYVALENVVSVNTMISGIKRRLYTKNFLTENCT